MPRQRANAPGPDHKEVGLMATSESKAHDPEETREESAKRLIGKRLDEHQETSRKLRDRLRLRAKHLSAGDRMAAIEFLRRNEALTIGLLEDTGGELHEFVWPSDAVDREWELQHD